MTVKFSFRHPNKDESYLRIVINHGSFKIINDKKVYQPLKVQLPWKVPTRLWNKNKEQITNSPDFPQAKSINAIIRKLQTAVEEYEFLCNRNGEETEKEGVKEAIHNVLSPKDTGKPKYFPDLMMEMIEKSESGERLSAKGTIIEPATIKKYRVALQHFENFEETYGDVTLKMLTEKLGEQIQTYFNEIGLARNTKASMLRQYIAAYNFAIRLGYIERGDFHKCRIENVPADTIALTAEEIDRIYNLNLRDNKEQEEIRDIFIVGIWTLMRFSDYSTIKDYNVKEHHIEVITDKTKVRVLLPLHWQVEEIMKKYNNQLPVSPTIKTFNIQLKKLAKMAGLNRIEEIKIERGGKVQKSLKQRWELVTTHTARRSGATILLLSGQLAKREIMLLTGHLKEQSFDDYIKIDKYATVLKLYKLDIFRKGKPKLTQASNYEEGWYWVSKNKQKKVAYIKDGIIEFLKNQIITLDTWFSQKGEVIEKINEPR